MKHKGSTVVVARPPRRGEEIEKVTVKSVKLEALKHKGSTATVARPERQSGEAREAEVFEREHSKIIRSIATITEAKGGLSEKFAKNNFLLGEYKDATGRKLPEYYMTKDGFVMLVMGFIGKKAMKFKEAYIDRFNNMELFISSLNTARLECPALTEAILQVHEEPKHYHFSNEMDMINRIVLGMTAKQYREAHDLGKVRSIRPYLDPEQIKLIEMLQRTDIGLVIAEPDFQKRKQTLEWYYLKLKEKLSRKKLTA